MQTRERLDYLVCSAITHLREAERNLDDFTSTLRELDLPSRERAILTDAANNRSNGCIRECAEKLEEQYGKMMTELRN